MERRTRVPRATPARGIAAIALQGAAGPPGDAESLERAFARWSAAVAVGEILFGFTMILAWAMQFDALVRPAPLLPSVNPVTAATLIACGLALAALRGRRGERLRFIGQTLGAFVCGVGLTRVAHVFAGIPIEIDQLLFTDYLAARDAMAPATGVGLILFGLSLVYLGGPRRVSVNASHALALAASSLALVTALGYAYEAPFLLEFGALLPMSLYTAIAFIALGTGILAARPRSAAMRVFASADDGGRLARRLLPAVLVIPVLAGFLRIKGERAGLFGAETGLALTVVIVMLLSSMMIWWHARTVSRDEAARKFVEATLRESELALREAYAELARAAREDPLTGVANRAALQQRLTEEFDAFFADPDRPFSLLMVDVDRFKAFNDTYGHVAGDEVLKQIARALSTCARGSDYVGRFGGEEFVMILPNTDAYGARVVAERVRGGVESTEWLRRPVTVSVGAATAWNGAAGVMSILHAADQALYAAKKAGRDRTVHADDIDDVTHPDEVPDVIRAQPTTRA